MSATVHLYKISKLIVLIAERLNFITDVHNRPVTRILIELFDVLLQLENEFAAVLAEIKLFQDESRTGWRVYHIHKVGLHLTKFADRSRVLCRWISDNQGFLMKAEVFTDDITTYWNRLDNDGWEFGRVAHKRIQRRIQYFCDQLQANKSPDPNLFPTTETVSTIADEINQALLRFSTAKSMVREFAVSKLTVEDFFRSENEI